MHVVVPRLEVSVATNAVVPPAARGLIITTAGAAVAVAATAPAALPRTDPWWYLVAAAIPVLYRFPISISRGSRTIEVGFESVVAVLLAFAVPDSALWLWIVGWAVAHVPLPIGSPPVRTSRWVSVLNVAMTVLGGAAAITVVTRLVPGALDGGPAVLAAVPTAALAYFGVDYVLSAIAMVALGRATFREAWLYDGLTVALGSAVGVATLGYLGALAIRSDAWAAPLIALPVASTIMACRGFEDASSAHGRVEALLGVASKLHQITAEEDVAAVLAAEGAAALAAEQVALVPGPPPGEGIHAEVVVDPDQPARWLVAAPRRSAMPYDGDDRGTLALLASMAADALRRLQLHAELTSLAATDPLTGLSNRATLQRSLESALAQRSGGTTAVLFCDLDGFKGVNDALGHDVGDQLLREVAERMRACVRDGDLVARMGGDEFVALLPGAGPADALVIAERITAALEAGGPLPGGDGVAVSIGVAVADGRQSAEELLVRADGAMYEAKSSGRGQVRVAGGVHG